MPKKEFENLVSDFLFKGSMNNQERLFKKARSNNPKEFVFVRATGSTVIETAQKSHQLNLIKPILVGEQEVIEREAKIIDWSLSKLEIIDTKGEEDAVAASIARYKAGDVAGFVKGNLHTDIFMGGLVKRDAGIRVGQRLVHVFVMLPPNGGKPLLISDAAINIQPDIDTRVEAALLMAKMSRKLGLARPKIAILSATESILPNIPSSVEALKIAQLAGEQDPNADFFGPLSLASSDPKKSLELNPSNPFVAEIFC